MVVPPVYLLKGFQLIFQKGYKRYSLAPILINTLSFIGLYGLSLKYLGKWIFNVQLELPSWLSWLENLWSWLQPVILGLTYLGIAFLMLFLVGFIASMLTSLLASPFHSQLCEKILIQSGVLKKPENSWLRLAHEAIQREIAKFIYIGWRTVLVLIVCLPFLLIPVLNIGASVILFLLGSWMLAVQYIDYAFEADHHTFKTCRKWLSRHKKGAWSFGMCCMASVSIPFINLISVSAAVAGATLYYSDMHSEVK